VQLRSAQPADFLPILALNEESVRFLSPLDLPRLAVLHQQATLHLVAVEDDAVIAFILLLREGAAYNSPNYQWFAARYPCFVYVDRVVVSERHQGRGVANVLYREVFAHARRLGSPLVACEFDVDPPNAASERFHAKFGFQEVGRQTVAEGKKLVSLQAAILRPRLVAGLDSLNCADPRPAKSPLV
jgi:uncharacterized protein